VFGWGKIIVFESQVACRQDELIGSKLPVNKATMTQTAKATVRKASLWTD
jgi:hypothetical protein